MLLLVLRVGSRTSSSGAAGVQGLLLLLLLLSSCYLVWFLGWFICGAVGVRHGQSILHVPAGACGLIV